LDRQTTCAAYEPTLFPVGSAVKAVANINLRATPGGGLLGFLPSGAAVTVLDFEIRNLGTDDRYYQVEVNGQKGWVYGGDKTDYGNWLVAAPTDGVPSVVARAGERVKVVNGAGINLRASAGGSFVLNVPAGTELSVLDYMIQGDNNYVYYQVSFAGKTGYIYSGMLLPQDSTGAWTVRLP
jgi:hypothetical protein